MVSGLAVWLPAQFFHFFAMSYFYPTVGLSLVRSDSFMASDTLRLVVVRQGGSKVCLATAVRNSYGYSATSSPR